MISLMAACNLDGCLFTISLAGEHLSRDASISIRHEESDMTSQVCPEVADVTGLLRTWGSVELSWMPSSEEWATSTSVCRRSRRKPPPGTPLPSTCVGEVL